MGPSPLKYPPQRPTPCVKVTAHKHAALCVRQVCGLFNSLTDPRGTKNTVSKMEPLFRIRI